MSSHGALWVRWKTLKLPWRKHFLVGKPLSVLVAILRTVLPLTVPLGQDLSGNTFWEFRPTLSVTKFRRIVRPLSPHTPVSDLVISPQWHQWLRYTRPLAPTIEEQRAEVGRQEGMRVLAREADERWKRKGSLLQKPKEKEKSDGWVGNLGEEVVKEEREEEQREENGPGRPSGAGEGWQPQAWAPKPVRKR